MKVQNIQQYNKNYNVNFGNTRQEKLARSLCSRLYDTKIGKMSDFNLNNEISSFFCERNPDFNPNAFVNGDSLLHHITRFDDDGVLGSFLSANSSVNFNTISAKTQLTPWQEAALLCDNPGVFAKFLEKGANKIDDRMRTPDGRSLKDLLKGKRSFVVDNYNIFRSQSSGYTDTPTISTVDELRGFDTQRGLQYEMDLPTYPSIDFLIDVSNRLASGDGRVPRQEYARAMEIAEYFDGSDANKSCSKMLTEARTTSNPVELSEITSKVRALDPKNAPKKAPETLGDIISHSDFNPKMTDSSGNNAGHLCVLSDDDSSLDWISQAVIKGVNINAKNEDGITPLLLSIILKKMDKIKKLVACEADITAVDKELKGVMHHAVITEDKEIISFIKKLNPNLNQMDISGKKPADYAETWKIRRMIAE